MGLVVFFSHSMDDTNQFEIPKIAQLLEREEGISEVIYCEKDCYNNFVKFMNDSLAKTDIFVLFCSPNAMKSDWVEQEWTTARASKKPIIPIFVDESHIPTLLKTNIRVQFRMFGYETIVKELYELILKIVRKVKKDDIALNNSELLKKFSELAAISIRIKIDDAVKNLGLDRNDLINKLKEWQSTIPLRIDGDFINLTPKISKSEIENMINEEKTIVSIVGDDAVKKYFTERKIPAIIMKLFLKLDELMQKPDIKIKPEFLQTAIRYKTEKRFFYLKPQQKALSIYLPLRLEDSPLLQPRANGDLWPEFKAIREEDIDAIFPVIRLALNSESEREAKLIEKDYSRYLLNIEQYIKSKPSIKCDPYSGESEDIEDLIADIAEIIEKYAKTLSKEWVVDFDIDYYVEGKINIMEPTLNICLTENEEDPNFEIEDIEIAYPSKIPYNSFKDLLVKVNNVLKYMYSKMDEVFKKYKKL